jgi:hypothetical protein
MRLTARLRPRPAPSPLHKDAAPAAQNRHELAAELAHPFDPAWFSSPEEPRATVADGPAAVG